MGEYTDKAAGKVKQAAGDLTDNPDLKREGEGDEAKGNVKEKANDAAEGIKHGVEKVREGISRT